MQFRTDRGGDTFRFEIYSHAINRQRSVGSGVKGKRGIRTGHAAIGQKPVGAGRQVERHPPVFVRQHFRSRFCACLDVISVFVVNKERQTVDLRGKCVGKLHVIVIDETQPQPFVAKREVVVDKRVAGGKGNHLQGDQRLADDR